MATLYASGASWNTANNWGTTTGATDGSVPTSSDDVIFDANSVSMAIDTNAVCKSIDSTGFTATLTQNTTKTLFVSGAVTWAAGTFAGGDSLIDVDGAFSLSGGAFTSTSGTLSARGDFTRSAGTFTHNSGTVDFSGSGATINCIHSFYTVTVNESAASNLLNLGANFTATNTITVSIGTFYLAGYDLACTNAFTIVGGNFLKLKGTESSVKTPTLNSNSTVVYSGDDVSNTKTCFNWSYKHLTIADGNTNKSTFKFGETHTGITTFTVANGTFDHSAGDYAITCTGFTQTGGTFTGGTTAVTVNGAFSLTNGTFTSTSGTLAVSGDFTRTAGTFTHNSGTVNFTGSSTLVSCSSTFYTITVNKTSATDALTLSGSLTVSNTVTVTASTLDLNGQDLACTNAFTVAATSFLKVMGTEVSVKTPTLTSGSTVVYYGDNVSNTKTCKNWTYKNLTINDWHGNKSTFKFGETHTGITTFTVTAGTFSQSAGDYAIGCVNYTQTGGTFTGGTTAITVGVGTFLLSGGAFTSTSGTLQINGTINPNYGYFTHTAGTFAHNNGTVTFYAGDYGSIYIDVPTSETFYILTLTCWNNAIIQLSGDTLIALNTLTITGNPGLNNVAVYNGTLEARGNVVIGALSANTGTAAVSFTGTADQTVTANGGTSPSGTWTINKASGKVSLATNLVLNTTGQDLVCTSGTLDLAGFNLTVNDAHTVASGFLLRLKGIETVSKTPTLASGSTVEYYGDNVANTKTCKNWTYKNLTINDTNANLSTFKFGETHTGMETFTVTAGTFSQSAGDYAITAASLIVNGGTFTGGTATVTVNGATGQFTVSSGTFTAPNGTLALGTGSGTFAISISGTFNANSGLTTITSANASFTVNVGTAIFNNVTFNLPSAVITLTGTWDVDGNIVITPAASGGGYNSQFAGGTIQFSGNLTRTGGHVDSYFNGTTIWEANGSSQTITSSDGNPVCVACLKMSSSGTVNITESVYSRAGYAVTVWEYASGTINWTSTKTFTVANSNNSLAIITGGQSFAHLSMSSGNGAGAMTITGACNTGNLTVSGWQTMTCASGFNVGGNFSWATSPTCTAAVTFNGAGTTQSVTVAGTMPSGTVTINKSSGSVVLAANWTINTTGQDLVCTSGTLDLAGFNLTVNDAHTVASGFLIRLKGIETVSKAPTFAAGSTAEYYGDNVANTKTCKNWSYKNLTFNDVNANLSTFVFGESHTGIATFIVTAGTFSQSAGNYAITCTGYTQTGGTFTGGSAALTVNGDWSLTTGAFTSTSGTLSNTGNFTINSGTFTHNSGTASVINGTGKTFTPNSADFYNLTINGTNGIISGTANILNNCSLSWIDNTGGTLNCAKDVYTNSYNYAANFIATSVLVVLTGTVDQSIIKLAGLYSNMPRVQVNKASGNVIFTYSFACTQWTWTTAAGLTHNNYGFTINCQNSCTNTFGGVSYASLTMASQAGGTTPTYVIADTATVTGAVSFGNCTISGGTVICGGDISVTHVWATAGTTAITLNGTGTQSITQTAGAFPGGTWTINKASGSATLAANCSLNRAGQDLVCTAGTLDLAGFNLTVNDAFTAASGFTLRLKGTEASVSTPTLASGSTVVYYGDNIATTKTCKNWAYKNMTVADVNVNLSTFKFGEAHLTLEQFAISGGTFSQAGGDYAITCAIFNQTGGVFTGGTAAVTCSGNYSVATGIFTSTSGTLTITGHFSHASGTWNHNNGVVALTGAGQSITGSTVFYTLTKNSPGDTLSFSAGGTFTFANNLSLQGSAGNKLNIRSLTPGTAYLIAFPSTRTLRNLDWADAENTVAVNPIHVQECSRSGKTYGLIFPGVI